MAEYIPKSALIAEIERRKNICQGVAKANENNEFTHLYYEGKAEAYSEMSELLDTIEVKEVDLDIMQRMEECPYRQVGCTMYEGYILECRGACSWVVDHLKLKELKAQKGEEV